MRTGGSLRVILNTKLYPGMTMENPTEKNIRLTGYDECGQVKVFLISGSSKDIGSLFSALKDRQKRGSSNNGASAPPPPSDEAAKDKSSTTESKEQDDDDSAKRVKTS